MKYKPLDQYGLIGDMNSAALVGTDGSIDWCCFPRFDCPSVFAAILDGERGGSFRIAPEASGATSSSQQYIPDTNVLVTRFTTDTGTVTLTDFMPLGNSHFSGPCPHEIHRLVRCTAGSVRVRCEFTPRLDYGRATTIFAPLRSGVIARGGRQALSLVSHVPLELTSGGADGEFTLKQGDEATFVLAYGHGRPARPESYQTHRKLRQAIANWQTMAASVAYDGMWREQVVRSFLALHLMVYEPTGAIIAAPTASLPETVGGSRNWDYRYSWLRDSSFTIDALYRMGHIYDGARYMGWLVDRCKTSNGHTRVVYGVSGNSSLKERTLDHLEGYRDSRPVRVGNGASRHPQLDVYGEVILGIDTLYRNGGGLSEEAWSLVVRFAETVASTWRGRDRSVWEVRGAKQHFVYSKLMCWAALDRAAALAQSLGHHQLTIRWRQLASVIAAEVANLGWSARKNSFV